MDPAWLDGLAKVLAAGAGRRGVLRALLSAALGGGLASAPLGGAAAGCFTTGKRCKHARQCCSGRCVKGECAPCGKGTKACGHACVDTRTDPRNCGRCGRRCVEGQVCDGGACTCNGRACAGCCDGTTCRSGDTNAACGLGGVACVACGEHEHCAQGACACDDGFHRCEGACVSDDDPAHCGNRCQPCPAPPNGDPTCTNGQCNFACDPGTQLCGDECVDTRTDPRNCGGCGNRCVVNEQCFGGVCGCGRADFSCSRIPGTVCCQQSCRCQTDGAFFNPATCRVAGSSCPSGTTACVTDRFCSASRAIARFCCPDGTTCDVAGGTCRYD